MRARNRNIFYSVLRAGSHAIIGASYKSFNPIAAPQDRSTSEPIAAADNHEITQATIKSNGTEIVWDSKDGHFKTTFRDTFQIENQLVTDKVPFKTEQPSSSNLLLSVILPNVILFLVIGGVLRCLPRPAPQRAQQAPPLGRHPPPPPARRKPARPLPPLPRP